MHRDGVLAVIALVSSACSTSSNAGAPSTTSAPATTTGAGGASGTTADGGGADGTETAEAGAGGRRSAPASCADACDHFADCGLSCPFDCGAARPSACVADCTVASSCADIDALGPAYQGCLGTCDGLALCKQCILAPRSTCLAVAGACAGMPDCQGWIDCVAACGDAACFSACDALHADAAWYYEPLYDCVCGSGCADLCVAITEGKCP